MKTIERGGRYYRVCDPQWTDCCDATFAAHYGGRWNGPDTIPVLYLNADVGTAKANALRVYEGEAFGLFDLNPTARPHLQVLDVDRCSPVDAVTDAGLSDLGLPKTYPIGIGHGVCQAIGERMNAARLCGIAYRSAARAGGEELALIDLALAVKRERRSFREWFLDEKTIG